MRRLLGVFVVAAISAGLPRPASACTCEYPDEPGVALKKADAVFVGKAIKGQLGPPTEPGWTSSSDPILVTFEVVGYWKGSSIGETIVIKTARSEASCGFGFERGREYVIYAYAARENQGMGLETSLCARTRSVKDATEDFEKLGSMKKPR